MRSLMQYSLLFVVALGLAAMPALAEGKIKAAADKTKKVIQKSGEAVGEVVEEVVDNTKELAKDAKKLGKKVVDKTKATGEKITDKAQEVGVDAR